MSHFKILLEEFKLRGVRHELIFFFETLTFFILGGYELGFAWQTSYLALEKQLSGPTLKLLRKNPNEELLSHLNHLSVAFPWSRFRSHFLLLKILYTQQTPMVESVISIISMLREEEERDWEKHLRDLPTKLNVLLILFFFPPTILILCFPVLLEFLLW